MASLEEIVDAAAEVFQRKGYHASTVQDVADAVGILKGSLYHHLRSKEDLLYLVVKQPIAEIYAAIAEIAASDLSPTEKLRRAMLSHLEGFDRHYAHMVVYMHEREEMKRIYRDRLNVSPKQYEAYWQRILREGVKSGEFRADLDVKVASYAVLGMLNGAYKWYDPRGRLGFREVADQFAKLALAGLRADKPRTGPDKRTQRPRAHN